jgi:hypothetical protein
MAARLASKSAETEDFFYFFSVNAKLKTCREN